MRASVLTGLICLWLLLGLDPVSPMTWWLENLLLIPFFLAFAIGHRRLGLSDSAFLATAGFLLLHLIGAHHTYSLVPYDLWSRQLLGFSPDAAFALQRNHYDRLVHFSFGALLALPVRECLRPMLGRGWSSLVTLLGLMAASMVYEFVEWGAALVFGGDAAMAFLGTQGDVWDAHMDMLLATLGTVLTLLGLHARALPLRRPVLPRLPQGRPLRRMPARPGAAASLP